MYNWIDDRRFSNSKTFSTLGFVPRNLNSYIRCKSSHWNNVNQLPVIKEEDGNASEDEIELENFIISTPNEKYYNKKRPNVGESGVARKKDSTRKEAIEGAKSLTKLPPIANVNCLMNCDVKQSQHIWNTSFARRLINGNEAKEELKPLKPKLVASSKAESVGKGSGKFGNTQPFSNIRPLPTKRVQDRNNKNGGGDREDPFVKPKNEKKKFKKITSAKKASVADKKRTKSEHEMKNVKLSETPGKPLTEDSSIIFSVNKNQHLLTECVKSILEGIPDEITCEHCQEKFATVEDLHDHVKKHEETKETCLLCEKIFYRPNDFVQHLLTHEGVDKFSCKKCKKYFPTLKKYQKHCKDFHFVPSESSLNQQNIDFVKKWLPKYECKRCKLEFDSEEAQRAHKRNHIRMDLAGAYLLSPKAV